MKYVNEILNTIWLPQRNVEYKYTIKFLPNYFQNIEIPKRVKNK